MKQSIIYFEKHQMNICSTIKKSELFIAVKHLVLTSESNIGAFMLQLFVSWQHAVQLYFVLHH